jgi:hypothetical protein
MDYLAAYGQYLLRYGSCSSHVHAGGVGRGNWDEDRSVKKGNADVQKKPPDSGSNGFNFVLREKWSDGKLTVQSDEMTDDR